MHTKYFLSPLDSITREKLMEGSIFVVDKPLHWTSFDVVSKIKWKSKYKFDLPKLKIGHAGTLDPLATGVIVICTGPCTKMIESLQAQEKVYTGSFFIGATTPSFDLETEPVSQSGIDHISMDELVSVASQFVGNIEQTPPIYSAVQQDGKRLYELARQGKTTEIKSRFVDIFEMKITGFQPPLVYFFVRCSKGTYIRSIADDFGKKLGTGAYLNSLRRTASGDFKVEDAWSVEELVHAFGGDNA